MLLLSSVASSFIVSNNISSFRNNNAVASKVYNELRDALDTYPNTPIIVQNYFGSGKIRLGETEVVVPKEVRMNYLVSLPLQGGSFFRTFEVHHQLGTLRYRYFRLNDRIIEQEHRGG